MEEENKKLAKLFLQNSKKLQQEKLQTSILFFKQFQKIKNKLIINKIFKEYLLNRLTQQQFNDTLFDPETYQVFKNDNKQEEKNEIIQQITKDRKSFAKFNYLILKNLHSKEFLCKYCYNCLKEYHKPDLLKNEHNFCKPIVNGDADFAFLYYDDFTELGMDYDGGGEYMAGIHYFGKRYNLRIYIGRPWNDGEHEQNYGSENPFYQLQLGDFQDNQGKMCREEIVQVKSRCYENQSDFDCEDDDRDDNSQCGQIFVKVNKIICDLYQQMVDQKRI